MRVKHQIVKSEKSSQKIIFNERSFSETGNEGALNASRV